MLYVVVDTVKFAFQSVGESLNCFSSGDYITLLYLAGLLECLIEARKFKLRVGYTHVGESAKQHTQSIGELFCTGPVL